MWRVSDVTDVQLSTIFENLSAEPSMHDVGNNNNSSTTNSESQHKKPKFIASTMDFDHPIPNALYYLYQNIHLDHMCTIRYVSYAINRGWAI